MQNFFLSNDYKDLEAVTRKMIIFVFLGAKMVFILEKRKNSLMHTGLQIKKSVQ